MAGVFAPKLSEPRPTALFFFGLPISEQTAGLQSYASDWNSVQTYASQIPTGECLPAPQTRTKARDSLQTYASNSANLWVK
jgi:hypothetical protein